MIEKGDYVLIEESLGKQHYVVRVDAISEYPDNSCTKIYRATVKKSVEESHLNTTSFLETDVQLVLGKINMKTLEEDYPEIFL